MIFEYQEVKSALAQIEIEDIGNCCLLSRNMLGEEKYLYILTEFGSTQIISYGPIIPDIDQLPEYVNYNYQRFDFSEQKIIKTIKKFVLDAEQVEETTMDYIYPCLRPMIDHLNKYE